MTEKKQLAVNMLAQIVSFTVSLGISFFLTPFITVRVGKEAYGFVGLANNFVSYAQIILTALNSMAARYITISVHKGKTEDANRYFSSVLFSNVLLTLVLTVPAVFVVCFLEKIVDVPEGILGDVRILWAVIFANALLTTLFSVFGCATYVKNRLELSSLRSIESNLLRAGLLFALFGLLQPHIYYVGIVTLCCSLYCVFANIYYTRKLLPEIRVRRSYFDFAKVRELLASGIWNSIGRISSILTDGLDLLIVNLFIDATAMGSVSLAKTLPSMILSVFGMLAGVFMPQLNISYAKGDFEDMKRQTLSAIKLLGMFASIPVACLFAFGDIFFSLWVPLEDARLLQGLAIASAAEFPFILAMEPIWNVFTVTNKIRTSTLFLISNSLTGILITFISLQFTQDVTVRTFLIVGISSLIAIIRAWTFMPLYTAKCLKMKPGGFYKVITKNFVVFLLVTAAALALRRFVTISSWIGLILVCFATGVLALAVNYFVMLGKDERAILKSKLRKIGEKI